VQRAYGLGILDPQIKQLPKRRKKRIIVVADSTFLITSGSTKGQKDQQGTNGALAITVSPFQAKPITAINMQSAIRPIR
jgi:hypothetical protein